jgi:hypothetical protein
LRQIPRVPLLVTILAALLALAPPGSAQPAKRCEAPPGTAGSEQYCETLPAGSGARQSTGRAGGGGSYDRGTRRALERAGSDGRGVLDLPSAGGRAQHPADARAGSRSGARGSRPDPPGAPIGSLGSALESGTSAGDGFVWLLLAAGLGIGGIAWWRWRRA